MSDRGNTGPNRTIVAVGILTAAIGIIPLLVAFGILPRPQDPSNPAPPWIIFLTGLVFFCAGIAVVLKGAVGGPPTSDGALPATTPRPLRDAYDLMVFAIVCSLGTLFTWIALGPDARHFTVSAGGLSMRTSGAGDVAGRVAFGFGSVLIWSIAGIILATMMRRWRGR